MKMMATDNETMCIDHSDMVQCAINAKWHYYSLKDEFKDSKKRISNLEKELVDAKKELEQLSHKLKSQCTIVDVLVNLCNHDKVRVMEVIDVDDILSDDRGDRSSRNEFESDSSDSTVGATMKRSNATTRANEKQPSVDDGSDSLSDCDQGDDSDSDVSEGISKKRRLKERKHANRSF
jgi:hypothetical protein